MFVPSPTRNRPITCYLCGDTEPVPHRRGSLVHGRARGASPGQFWDASETRVSWERLRTVPGGDGSDGDRGDPGPDELRPPAVGTEHDLVPVEVNFEPVQTRPPDRENLSISCPPVQPGRGGQPGDLTMFLPARDAYFSRGAFGVAAPTSHPGVAQPGGPRGPYPKVRFTTLQSDFFCAKDHAVGQVGSSVLGRPLSQRGNEFARSL
jgi:hypothetical protein